MIIITDVGIIILVLMFNDKICNNMQSCQVKVTTFVPIGMWKKSH